MRKIYAAGAALVVLLLTLLISFRVKIYLTEQKLISTPTKLKIAYVDIRGLVTDRRDQSVYFKRFLDITAKAVRGLESEMLVCSLPFGKSEAIKIFRDFLEQSKPDGILMIPFMPFTSELLSISGSRNIPCVTINGRAPENCGTPLEKHRLWIAEVYSDEQKGGFSLAKALIEKALEPGNRGELHILAFSGPEDFEFASKRLKGLRQALNLYPNIKLDQVVTSDYTFENSAAKFRYLKKARFPEASIVWCDSDTAALGVLDAAQKMGHSSIITGGFDWIEDAVQSISMGQMTASAGGQLANGAWAAVLIVDYLNGIKPDRPTYITEMSVLDKSKALRLLEQAKAGSTSSEKFRSFSKHYNKGLSVYNFTASELIK